MGDSKKMPEHVQQVRRKLLKLGAYAPPAILGSMVAVPSSASAATINCGGQTYTVSATGIACCPCATSMNSWQCRQAQCSLGNCQACNNWNVFTSQQQCKNFAKGPCSNGCKCQQWGRGGGNKRGRRTKYWVCR